MGTRADAPRSIAFDRDQLLELVGAHGPMVARAAEGLPPLTFRLTDGRALSFVPGGGRMDVEPGEVDGATVVELDDSAWDDLLSERLTTFGVLYTERARITRGEMGAFTSWEAPLRSLTVGRPPYDEHRPLRGADGVDLDLDRSFTLEDPDEAIAEFLHVAGFAVVRGVLGRDEVDALRAEVDRLAADAEPGDHRSWWTTDASGAPALCRLTYTGQRSARIRDLHDDARIRRLRALSGEELHPATDRMDGESVVIKVPGAAEGLADLPWHVDCGLGMHPVICPAVLIGIQLDAATPESGQLHFLAGSYGTTCPQSLPHEGRDLPTVAVRAEPGDCTIHFADTLHAAPPPLGDARRRTLYVSYHPPSMLEAVPAGRATNDVLAGHDDGHILSPEELAAR